MALGRRKKERQQEMWVETAALPRSEGHVFYGKLNRLLGTAGDVATDLKPGGAADGAGVTRAVDLHPHCPFLGWLNVLPEEEATAVLART